MLPGIDLRAGKVFFSGGIKNTHPIRPPRGISKFWLNGEVDYLMV